MIGSIQKMPTSEAFSSRVLVCPKGFGRLKIQHPENEKRGKTG
jgi:hypothetical protein